MDNIDVLVVDDHIALRTVLVMQLAKLGIKADSAANGVEAVHRIHNWRYKLILMDVQMPELDGLEATAAIRSYEHSENLESTIIIAVTGGGTTKKKCLDAGMNGYVEKPLPIEALKDLIEEWAPRLLQQKDDQTS